MERVIQGNTIVSGHVQGKALVSNEPLSFWGGYDQNTGEIIDQRHPLAGQNAGGNILAIPFSRGSTTTAAVLLEAVKTGKSPLAILTIGVDKIFALASIVADEIFGKLVPIVSLEKADFATLRNNQWIEIHPNGTLIVNDM
jgi:predicted aconitase with swiveling domain